MKTIKHIFCIIFAGFLLFGCGMAPICKSYSPHELDWHGYNTVTAFKQYFNGYIETIHEHIGDTVRVVGRFGFQYMTNSDTSQWDSNELLKTFYDTCGSGKYMFIENNNDVEIPIPYYDKTLYVTGTVKYYEELHCNRGTTLELTSIDTIPEI